MCNILHITEATISVISSLVLVNAMNILRQFDFCWTGLFFPEIIPSQTGSSKYTQENLWRLPVYILEARCLSCHQTNSAAQSAEENTIL